MTIQYACAYTDINTAHGSTWLQKDLGHSGKEESVERRQPLRLLVQSVLDYSQQQRQLGRQTQSIHTYIVATVKMGVRFFRTFSK
jgi:hypothetical protein